MATLFDRLYASVWPSHQLRRLRARRANAAYEGARPDRDRRRERRETRGPNAPVREAARPLRERVRELEQNTDIVPGALAALVANVVGAAGATPEPRAANREGELDEALNARLRALWEEWAQDPEVTGQFHEVGAQEIACRTWLRDGEVFARHHTGHVAGLPRGAVPYRYELLEPDLIPADRRRGRPGDAMGVELDAWNRPVAYQVLARPFDDRLPRAAAETVRVPADRMTHLAHVTRIGQVRGVSPFAPVLSRLADIDDIDEAERIAARIAAAMAAYIKKGEPHHYEPPAPGAASREIELEPGLVIDDLRPGEDVGTIAANRPNREVMAFRAEQLRAVAGGIGVSYSTLARRYDGTYSSQRQELVEQSAIYRSIWRRFIDRWERPKWRRFVLAAELAGLIGIPPAVERKSVFLPAYTAPALPWIDPLREVKAWQALLESRLESREHIARLRGRDPRHVEREIDREARGG